MEVPELTAIPLTTFWGRHSLWEEKRPAAHPEASEAGREAYRCSEEMVKNLPAVQETWVQSMGWEDPLEKGMAIHSNILAWRIPWTEEPGGLQSMVLQSQTRLSN